MYLALLSREEKELFLGLAHHLAVSDGHYGEEEKAMMAGYCQEMQIAFEAEGAAEPVEALLKRFCEMSDQKARKIVVFETVGLALADGTYDGNERKLIAKMEDELQLESGFAGKCAAILEEYVSFQNRINQLVLG